jgi:alpha,alpha-trehalase
MPADDGRWEISTGNLRCRWSGAADARVDSDGVLRLRPTVPAHHHHDLLLEIGTGPQPAPVDADTAWSATEREWQTSVPSFADSAAPGGSEHAYAVLRGLTVPGGGMVAAVILGMPERADAGRDYDYRYVWLRDPAYAGLAVAVQDAHELLDEAMAFTTARVLTDGDKIRPAYRTDGTRPPEETTLDLPGYPGGNDVVGNGYAGSSSSTRSVRSCSFTPRPAAMIT